MSQPESPRHTPDSDWGRLHLLKERDRLLAENGRLRAALEEIADICRGPAATLNELAHAVETSARAALGGRENA